MGLFAVSAHSELPNWLNILLSVRFPKQMVHTVLFYGDQLTLEKCQERIWWSFNFSKNVRNVFGDHLTVEKIYEKFIVIV